MTRYVIVGSGAAGIGAVEGIRSLDADGEINLICEEKEGYYSRPGLAYMLTGELSEKQIYPFNDHDFQRRKVQRIHGRAVGVNLNGRLLLLEDGRQISYGKLLIAAGATAARANLPGIEAEGVVKLDNLADARQIIARARKGETAAVVGGGITALEIVEGLVTRRVKVHYLLRGDRYWSNVLDEVESRLVERRLQREGVQIHYHTELAEVLTKNRRVEGVLTRSGEKIPCRMLAVAIGVVPRLELAQAAGLKVDRGVVVDEHLETSQAGVFSAGDVAQVYDPLTRKYLLDSLWGPARQQGTTAGKNMAAQILGKPPTSYIKGVAFNVTRLANLTTTIIGRVGNGRDDDLAGVGIARGDSEVWRQLPECIAAQAGFSTNNLRLALGEETILGAVVMGDQTLSLALQFLVADQVDITPIRSQLLQPEARIADVLAEFWQSYRDGSSRR